MSNKTNGKGLADDLLKPVDDLYFDETKPEVGDMAKGKRPRLTADQRAERIAALFASLPIEQKVRILPEMKKSVDDHKEATRKKLEQQLAELSKLD